MTIELSKDAHREAVTSIERYFQGNCRRRAQSAQRKK